MAKATEKQKEYMKQYEAANKEKIKARKRDKYLENRDNLLLQKKEYYIENKKEISKRKTIYRQNNKIKISEQVKIRNKKIKTRFNQYKGKARRAEMDFELTLEQFEKLVTSNCFYCGGFGYGVDRVNNEIGYSILNSVFCCILNVIQLKWIIV